MLDHAREAVEICSKRSSAEFHADRVLQLAVVRLLEVIGEAANRVSKSFQEKTPEIARPQIIAFRNRVIHGYDQVDLDIVWRIVESDLPELCRQLDRALAQE
jgi:uncharacterized protein with HEPN domain